MGDLRAESLRVAVVILGLIAFVALYGWFLVETFTADGETPTFSEFPVRFAIGLAATLGGLFTLAAGVQSSRTRAAGPNPPALGPSSGRLGMLTVAGGGLVGRDTPVDSKPVRFANVGAWLYLFVGLAAAVAWGAKGDVTPDVVRTLASIWAGYVLAVFSAAVGAPAGPPNPGPPDPRP